jgi:hypothetical protein
MVSMYDEKSHGWTLPRACSRPILRCAAPRELRRKVNWFPASAPATFQTSRLTEEGQRYRSAGALSFGAIGCSGLLANS